MIFLNLFVLALGFGGMQMGFAISGNNQTANVIAAKFDWTEKETRFFNSLINSCSILGMAVGSFSGGIAIQMGRRKTSIIFNILSVISLCTTLILSLPAIVIGKFLFGFSSGVINVAHTKMLDETVPVDLLGAFGIATNLYICFGIGLAMIVGAGLPEEGDI